MYIHIQYIYILTILHVKWNTYAFTRAHDTSHHIIYCSHKFTAAPAFRCSFFDVRDPRRDVQLSMAEVPWQGDIGETVDECWAGRFGTWKNAFSLMHSEELVVEMVVKLWKNGTWELGISIWFILGYSRLHSRSFSLDVCCLGQYELVCIDPVDSWLCFIVGWSHLSLLTFWDGLYYLVGGSEHVFISPEILGI